MKRKIILHGHLRKAFGKSFELDVDSVGGAVRLLQANFPNFLRELRTGYYHIILGDREAGETITGELINFGLGEGDIQIIPVAGGAGKKGGFLQAIAGYILIGLSIAFPGPWSETGIRVGTSLIISGTTQILVSSPDGAYSDDENAQESFLFDGGANTQEQGLPVPFGYGRIRIGSHVISGGLTTEDVDPGGKTLQSRQTARILDLLCEGEIGGLVDGPKSVYFDNTPLMSDVPSGDYGEGFNYFTGRLGSLTETDIIANMFYRDEPLPPFADNGNGVTGLNYLGAIFEERTGTDNQDVINGFSSVESEISVGSIDLDVGVPSTQSIANTDVDAVRVSVRTNAIFHSTEEGKTKPHTVEFLIRRRTVLGSWTTSTFSISGKAFSPYEKSVRVDLPGPGPYEIQVERITAKKNSTSWQDSLTFESYTTIIDHKLSYPGSALIGTTFDAEQFGGRIPTRTYDCYLKLVEVPSNFNPVTRVYTGLWDGTFVKAWTDSAPWCTRDLAMHRWGGGLEESQIDAAALYTIAQYSDEMIDDGKGGTEPRFSMNCLMNSQAEAFAVLNSMASNFRAMSFWSSGMVQFSHDGPKTPEFLVTPANVVDGLFTYEGSDEAQDYSVCIVSWNDPDNNYRLTPEPVINQEMVRQIGWKEKKVHAFGCTSRGQARRFGQWHLTKDEIGGEMVSYQSGTDHAFALPGEIIEIADPDYAGIRMGGRLAAGSTTGKLKIDDPFDLEVGEVYKARVVMPDLTIEERTVTTLAGVTSELDLDVILSAVPEPGAVWVLESTTVTPRTYRVVSAIPHDSEPGIFAISALYHDNDSYPSIDAVETFDPDDRFTDLLATDFIARPGVGTITLVSDGGAVDPSSVALVTWAESAGPFLRGYEVRYRFDAGNWTYLTETSVNYVEISRLDAGDLTVEVRAINRFEIPSDWREITDTIAATRPFALPTISSLIIAGQLEAVVKFDTQDIAFEWQVTRPSDVVNQDGDLNNWIDPYARDFRVQIYDGAAVVATYYTTERRFEYTYERNVKDGGPFRPLKIGISLRDIFGTIGTETTKTITNDAPAIPANVSIRAGVGQINLKFDKPSETDWLGSKIWVSTNPAFTPDALTETDLGQATFAAIPATEGTTYYVYIAAYDSYNQIAADLTKSGPHTFTLRSYGEFENSDLALSVNGELTWNGGTINLGTVSIGGLGFSGELDADKTNIHTSYDTARVNNIIAATVQGDSLLGGDLTRSNSTILHRSSADGLDFDIGPASYIDQGNTVMRPVTRGAADGSGDDAEAITYSTAWNGGDLPIIKFGGGGITYSPDMSVRHGPVYSALNPSTTGFTIKARLREVTGAQIIVTDGPKASAPWELQKSASLEAYDDNYEFKINWAVGNTWDSELGKWIGGHATIEIWVNDGGGYTQVGSISETGGFNPAGSTTAKTSTKIVTVDGVGIIAGTEFKIVIATSSTAGTVISQFTHVKYTTVASVVEETATPTGSSPVDFDVKGGSETL